MGAFTRLGFIAFGLLLIVFSAGQIRSGQFVFDNASYHQQTFAAGGIGVGILFILLAFLPLVNGCIDASLQRSVLIDQEEEIDSPVTPG